MTMIVNETLTIPNTQLTAYVSNAFEKRKFKTLTVKINKKN